MHHISSPRTDDRGIEAEIVDKGKTAPRITPADVAANIVGVYYFTAWDAVNKAQSAPIRGGDEKSLSVLTFCVLVLRNGFTITGESACASAENFDAGIGRQIARENAVQKIWPLMGYELKCRLAAEEHA